MLLRCFRPLLIVLLCLLTACAGFAPEPPQSVIEQAIAIQLAEIQQNLIIQLAPKMPQLPNVKLSQVKVLEREQLQSGQEPVYRLRGSYQAQIQLPSRDVQDSSLFEIYLQKISDLEEPGSASEHWYLTSLNSSNSLQTWKRGALVN
jgi:hypothetical protein